MKGLASVAALLLPVMASAQERPAVRPTHDVTVDYQLQAVDAHGSASVRIIRLSWTGNGNRLRLDMQGGTGFVLVDYAAHRMELVITQQKAFVALPFDPSVAPGLSIPPDVAMHASGSEQVAGTRCTVWIMRAPGAQATACITNDGLLLSLRTEDTSRPALEAIRVTYGTQAPGLFEIPNGFSQIAPSH